MAEQLYMIPEATPHLMNLRVIPEASGYAVTTTGRQLPTRRLEERPVLGYNDVGAPYYEVDAFGAPVDPSGWKLRTETKLALTVGLLAIIAAWWLSRKPKRGRRRR